MGDQRVESAQSEPASAPAAALWRMSPDDTNGNQFVEAELRIGNLCAGSECVDITCGLHGGHAFREGSVSLREACNGFRVVQKGHPFGARTFGYRMLPEGSLVIREPLVFDADDGDEESIEGTLSFPPQPFASDGSSTLTVGLEKAEFVATLRWRAADCPPR